MKDFINKVKDKFVKKEKVAETSEEKRLRLLQEEKKQATKDKKPWVAVLNTHVNEKDIKNGFFELDWNISTSPLLANPAFISDSTAQTIGLSCHSPAFASV